MGNVKQLDKDYRDRKLESDPNSNDEAYQTRVKRNIFLFTSHPLLSLYGLYLILQGQYVGKTVLFATIYGYLGGFGINVGAHRLWAHRSFKAKTPLKIILLYLQTLAWQESLYEWVRDHRVHHKYTETDADPYNAKRGFFFAHIGWLVTRKHEAVISKLKSMDMSDLESDPIVMFQHRHYPVLLFLTCYLIPFLVPWYFWNETLLASFISVCIRITLGLHSTFLVNSAAHLWGYKPYDKNIGPVENKIVSILALGEGWHNYHHVFPWDYKAAELGTYKYNLGTAVIDFLAWIGWAYDLKTVSQPMIRERAQRTGDGSRQLKNNNKNQKDGCLDYHKENGPWGWGDEDIPQEDIEVTQVLYCEKNK